MATHQHWRKTFNERYPDSIFRRHPFWFWFFTVVMFTPSVGLWWGVIFYTLIPEPAVYITIQTVVGFLGVLLLDLFLTPTKKPSERLADWESGFHIRLNRAIAEANTEAYEGALEDYATTLNLPKEEKLKVRKSHYVFW